MAAVQPEMLHPNKSVRDDELGREGIGREIGGFRTNRRISRRIWRRRERRRIWAGMGMRTTGRDNGCGTTRDVTP